MSFPPYTERFRYTFRTQRKQIIGNKIYLSLWQHLWKEFIHALKWSTCQDNTIDCYVPFRRINDSWHPFASKNYVDRIILQLKTGRQKPVSTDIQIFLLPSKLDSTLCALLYVERLSSKSTSIARFWSPLHRFKYKSKTISPNWRSLCP